VSGLLLRRSVVVVLLPHPDSRVIPLANRTSQVRLRSPYGLPPTHPKLGLARDPGVAGQNSSRVAWLFDAAIQCRIPTAIHTNLPITSTALSRWFAPWSRETLYRATQRAAARFLTDRGLFVPVAKPGRFDPLVSQYRSHLIDLRGLSPSTVEQHLSTVTGFLASACSGRRRLASVRSEDIEHFIEQTSKRFCRQSLQHTVAHLRAFLRFCADRGYTRNRLDVIDTPRTYRKRGRKQRFDEAIFEERFRTIERVFAWEDKFRRLLLRFERISQMHYALKTLAYTMINLRHYCRH
jgi:hypothetical protein